MVLYAVANVIQDAEVEGFPVVGLQGGWVGGGCDLLVGGEPLADSQRADLPARNFLLVHVNTLGYTADVGFQLLQLGRLQVQQLQEGGGQAADLVGHAGQGLRAERHRLLQSLPLVAGLQVVALAVLSHTLQVVVVVAQALPCRGDIAGLQRLRHGAGTGAHFLPSLSGVAF